MTAPVNMHWKLLQAMPMLRLLPVCMHSTIAFGW